MSKFILTDVRYFAGGVDLTGASNKVEIATEVEAKDATTYGSGGWKESLGGLASSEWKAGGFWEAGDDSKVDDATWNRLGGVGAHTAVISGGGAVGDVAYFTQAMTGGYTLLGNVGEIAPWQANAQGSYPTVRGLVAHPPGTARTANGTGTAQELGAVASGQYIYASLHVLSLSGTGTPTITARVESDDASGFASATTRATFDAATAAGGQVIRAAGAIADTWWRIAWTVSGTSPSFLFAAALGIR